MEKILEELREGKYQSEPPQRKTLRNLSELFEEPVKRTEVERKQAWYKIGKVFWRGHKPKLHKESQIGTRRTYEYYSLRKGDWSGPSCRQLSKMSRFKYGIELTMRGREFSEENSLLNEGNLEEPQLAQGNNGTADLDEIFSAGLEMDEQL